MSDTPAVHSSFVIERIYPQAPERVFAALADEAKKRRWFADDRGNGIDLFEMDFRVGGSERLSYRLGADTSFPGSVFCCVGQFHDIVPNRRVVTAARMDFGSQPMSSAIVTLELEVHDGGTRLTCTHQAVYFSPSDGPAMREQGWRKLLERLAEALD